MILSPVIVRELRAESRRPLNYWLRVLSATAAIAALATAAGFNPTSTLKIGPKLFTAIHSLIFVSIWVGAPLLTADCLAREKREGTLPLLFLTPLTARGVVIGKSVVHLMRAITLLVAVWPVLAIPLLFGGINSGDVAAAASFEFGALLASFSAGLVVSAWTKNWNRAMILAEVAAAFTFFLFGCGFALCSAISARALSQKLPWEHVGIAEFFESIFTLSTGMDGIWNDIVRVPAFASVWYDALGLFVFFNACLLALAIVLASLRLRHHWRDDPATPRRAWLNRAFTTPMIFRGYLRRALRQRLSKNPIAWLQRYSWSARMTEWGWFAFCMLILTEEITSPQRFYGTVHLRGFVWLGLTLLVGVAFSAVGSFQREKENGVIELLLVTPLSDPQIVWGRILGVWNQFAPAILLLIGTRIYLWTDSEDVYSGIFSLVVLLGSFFLASVFGLYFALRTRNFFLALLQTCLVSLIAPILLTFAIGASVSELMYGDSLPSTFRSREIFSAIKIIAYLAVWPLLSIAALRLLFKLLRSRKFASLPGRA